MGTEPDPAVAGLSSTPIWWKARSISAFALSKPATSTASSATATANPTTSAVIGAFRQSRTSLY
jgi:hypothetical protein